MVTLTFSLIVTGLAWYQACLDADDQLARTNRELTERTAREVQDRFDRIERALEVARGFALASEYISRDEWRRFVSVIDIEQAYPGVHGFAYVAQVERSQLDELSREMEQLGFEAFGVRDSLDDTSVAPGNTLYVVKYHEPETINGAAIGLNVAASRVNREAYDEARDTGAIRSTGPFTLHQDGAREPGLVLAAPIYAHGLPTNTVEARRLAIRAWVAAPVGLAEFFRTGVDEARDRFVITLAPGAPEDTSEPVLITGGEAIGDGADAPAFRRVVLVGERPWTLGFRPRVLAATTPSLGRANTILGFGLIISVLLSAIVWTVSRTRSKAEQLAESMTASLRRNAGRQQALAASAKAASRAKSEFLANMSHEIRTPMTAILGYAELLDERVYKINADDEVREWLGSIRRSGEHLLTIINDVLDLSKIESGRLSTRLVEQSVEQVVHDVIDPMRSRARQKGLELRAEIDGPVPSVIMTDPARLRQVLINLVGNAVKFTESGEVVLRLSTSGSAIVFEVRDTGIGIDEASIPNLFEAFVQADSSMARSHEGTGLGLAISRRLARLMGGDLTANSTLGQGSAFRVSLPIGNIEQTSTISTLGASSQVAAARPGADQQRSSGRVLLVEDGVDNQRLITHFLRRAGFTIDLAQHGQEALDAMARGAKPDVILMDMQMPVMDGYTAATRLRELGFTTPIVALTAHAMEGDREKCINAGCDEYATKPVDRRKLVGLVTRLIEQGTSRNAA